jgi:hypothetical protein
MPAKVNPKLFWSVITNLLLLSETSREDFYSGQILFGSRNRFLSVSDSFVPSASVGEGQLAYGALEKLYPGWKCE